MPRKFRNSFEDLGLEKKIDYININGIQGIFAEKEFIQAAANVFNAINLLWTDVQELKIIIFPSKDFEKKAQL